MILKCRICGTKFKTYPSRVKINKGKYCSKLCVFKALKGKISPKRGIKLSKEQKSKLNLEGLRLGWGWNKGKKLTPTHIEKHRLAMLGKIPWNKGLKGFLGGDKHWNWQNGISKLHKSERQYWMGTFEYRFWRHKVFERDNFTCIFCGQIRGNIEADHIKSWRDYPKLRFKISNGRTLCNKCHIKTESYGNKKSKNT